MHYENGAGGSCRVLVTNTISKRDIPEEVNWDAATLSSNFVR